MELRRECAIEMLRVPSAMVLSKPFPFGPISSMSAV